MQVYLNQMLYASLTDSDILTEAHHINGKGKDGGVVYSEMKARLFIKIFILIIASTIIITKLIKSLLSGLQLSTLVPNEDQTQRSSSARKHFLCQKSGIL